jgi:hypothetical protein
MDWNHKLGVYESRTNHVHTYISYICNPVDLSFVNLSIQAKHIRSDLEKWVNWVLMCGGLFTLFKITYIKFPVQDLAPNHKVSKPGLEPQAWASEIWSRARAHCKPLSGPGLAWAWTGSARRAQGLKPGPAHHYYEMPVYSTASHRSCCSNH